MRRPTGPPPLCVRCGHVAAAMMAECDHGVMAHARWVEVPSETSPWSPPIVANFVLGCLAFAFAPTVIAFAFRDERWSSGMAGAWVAGLLVLSPVTLAGAAMLRIFAERVFGREWRVVAPGDSLAGAARTFAGRVREAWGRDVVSSELGAEGLLRLGAPALVGALVAGGYVRARAVETWVWRRSWPQAEPRRRLADRRLQVTSLAGGGSLEGDARAFVASLPATRSAADPRGGSPYRALVVAGDAPWVDLAGVLEAAKRVTLHGQASS